jgi:hypothetical protein
VISIADVAGRLAPPVDPARPGAAEALVAALRAAMSRFYDHEKPAEAAAALERAAQDALGMLSRLLVRGPLWEAARSALLLAATSALLRGDEARARRLCDLIVLRDPQFEPPPRDVPPKVRALYAEERTRLHRVRVPLTFVGPPGVEVLLDGLPRGRTPLTLEVTPGPHEVQGLEEGVLSPPQRLDVGPAGAKVTLEPFCAAAAQLSTRRCRDFLRRTAGAAVIVELAAAATQLRVRVLRGAALLRESVLELPARLGERWLGELADHVTGARSAPPIVERPAPVVVVSPPAKLGTPLYKRWWFWTVIGVAVVGAGAGALLAPRGQRTLDVHVSR